MYETKKGYTNDDTHISIAFKFTFILLLFCFYSTSIFPLSDLNSIIDLTIA